MKASMLDLIHPLPSIGNLSNIGNILAQGQIFFANQMSDNS